MDAETSLNNETADEATDNEQDSDTSQSFSSPIAVDSSVNNDTADESIADVIERPTVRSCANKAKNAITAMFTGGRNH